MLIITIPVLLHAHAPHDLDALAVFGHMLIHAIVSFLGVVGADGLRDLPVGADGVLQQAGCLELGEHLNTIGDHGHDLGDHTVVGAAGHIGVEFLVGRAVVLAGTDLVLHLLTQLAQSVLFVFLNACLLYTSPSPRDTR